MADYSVVTAPRNTYLGIWDRLPQDKQNIYMPKNPAADNTCPDANNPNALRTTAKKPVLETKDISRADRPAETKSIQAQVLEEKENEKPGATQHGLNMMTYHAMKKRNQEYVASQIQVKAS